MCRDVAAAFLQLNFSTRMMMELHLQCIFKGRTAQALFFLSAFFLHHTPQLHNTSSPPWAMNRNPVLALGLLLCFFVLTPAHSYRFNRKLCSKSVHFKYKSKGLCNYFIQFRSLLIGAKRLKKNVCAKSTEIADGKTSGDLFVENITSFYDMAELRKFVNFEDDTICAQCFYFNNETSTPPVQFQWPNKKHVLADYNLFKTIQTNEKYLRPHTTDHPLVLHMSAMVGVFEDVKQEYIPLVQHMRAPKEIVAAADEVQSILFGNESGNSSLQYHEQAQAPPQKKTKPFACMHWRFEEAKCGWKLGHKKKLGHKSQLGLCFRSSEKMPCDNTGSCFSDRKKSTSLVRIFTVEMMVEAISSLLRRHNISNLLLITDGQSRNQSDTVDAFMAPFGSSCKTIAATLPPSRLHSIMSPIKLNNSFTKFAALERKLCANADLVIGSAISSFTTELFLDHARHDEAVLEALLNNGNQYRNPWDIPNRCDVSSCVVPFYFKFSAVVSVNVTISE